MCKSSEDTKSFDMYYIDCVQYQPLDQAVRQKKSTVLNEYTFVKSSTMVCVLDWFSVCGSQEMVSCAIRPADS